MLSEYKIFCAGEFISTENKLAIINPFDNKEFAHTYLADETILNTAIEKALQVQKELKDLPSYKKFEVLKYISEQLKSKREELAQLLCLESGKPMKYALTEIDRSAQTFLIAAEESKRLPKEYLSLDWTPNGVNREGVINYFPIGLVAGIAPFNFPMNLAVHKIAPAIASGCPIILKPASKTPLSTLALAKIIAETDLPKGAVSILPCNRLVGELLVRDERIKLLSFTGSPEIGWKMKAKAGKKKVVLELGGNAGVIITEKTNITSVIKKCLAGAFAYSGQICIHAQRFVVHESLFDEFIEALKKEAQTLTSGNPLDTTTDFSVMIDEENAKRAEQWINEAIESGAKLICGGKRNGNYFEPTILTNCNTNMKVYAEEVFAPIITIEKYSNNIEEAVNIINNTRFGLQCGVFTDSIEELNYCMQNLEVGGIIHNDVPTLRFDQMPYGGIKDSGLGREGVRYAIMDMIEAKLLVK
jgi:acyl-CoA reductase-like NAD-dependent aldehyde dehydrogenase